MLVVGKLIKIELQMRIIIFCLAIILLPLNAKANDVENYLVDQFKPFQARGVKQADLDKFEKIASEIPYCRYKIKEQKLNYNCNGDDKLSIHKFLKTLLKNHNIPNVDFILFSSDMFPGVTNLEGNEFIRQLPIFIMSKDVNDVHEGNFVLFPDLYMQKFWKKELRRVSRQVRKNYWSKEGSWNKKENKVFWRGATSSRNYSYELSNLDKIARLRLVTLSSLYPELIDAKFSITTLNDDMSQFLNMIDGIKPVVKSPEHLPYKYLISVDGMTASWLRIPWILYSDSVLVKQESSIIQWFYPALKPYVHYVPVKEDLSDLFQQIEWMINNDDAVKQISINATKFIESQLMPKNIEKQMVLVLKEYAKLQR